VSGKEKVIGLQMQTRPLTEKERKALKKIRVTTDQKLREAVNLRRFLIPFLLGAICAYLAYQTDFKILMLLFGTIAILSLGYIFFIPFEIFKEFKIVKAKLVALNAALQKETVDVSPVSAKQFALAKEHEDEGDLYIIETTEGNILYVWDDDYNLKKVFPCLSFEVYEQEFAKLIGRQVNPLSEKINPIVVDAKAKWAYLENNGAPGNLSVEKKDFNKLVTAMTASLSK
jgi:hypothetical protein